MKKKNTLVKTNIAITSQILLQKIKNSYHSLKKILFSIIEKKIELEIIPAKK